jgi:peptidoglycan/LPS O-acetylase OafA/YrhL
MPAAGWLWLDRILQLRATLWVGVDLFFVLSGYLISGILMDHHACANRFKTFYLRRTLRIFPLYYLALAIVFGGLMNLPSLRPMVESGAGMGWFLSYGFNIQLALQGEWPATELLNHFWTLCVEEQFYLVWPLAVFAVPVRRFPWLVATAVVVATVWKAGGLFAGSPPMSTMVSMPGRMDAFAMGGLAAYAARFWELGRCQKFASGLAVASALVLTGMAFPTRGLAWDYPSTVLPGSLLLSIFFSCLVFLVVHPVPLSYWLTKMMRRPLLRWLGKYSYGIYVFHWLVHYPLVRLNLFGLSWHPWVAFLAVLAATAVLSVISFHWFEMPFLRLKERFRFADDASRASSC